MALANGGRRGFQMAASLFALALAVYWLALWLTSGSAFPQSPWPYFTYYARALLDGSLHFTVRPPATLDLAFYGGRIYMHHPPFPAVVLAPLTALFGLGLSDRFCSVLLGALNGAAVFALLGAADRRGLMVITGTTRILLTLFFLFGTVHAYLAITGNPWEFAHVVCNGLLALALLLCLHRRYAWGAAAYVAVLFTRSHVFLGFPVLLGLYWMLEGREGRSARERRAGLLGLGAIGAAGVALLLAWNAARFGDPLESGVSHHLMHEAFRARYAEHGYFDLAYLPRNLYALLLQPPVPSAGFPFFSFSPAGLGLFFASPLYLYLFASARRPRRPLALLLWAGVVPALVPILLVMGTGELQFGHRYSSDLSVLLILLTALGLEGRTPAPPRSALALLLLSVAMNAYGTWWFVTRYAG